MRIPPRNAGTWLNYQYEQEDGEFTMTLTHGTNSFAGEGDNMAQVRRFKYLKCVTYNDTSIKFRI